MRRGIGQTLARGGQGLLGWEHVGQSAENTHCAECDDEWMEIEPDDEAAVDEPAEQSDAKGHGEGNGQNLERRGVLRKTLHGGRRTQSRESHDRAHRDIDPSGDNHDGESHGHDCVVAHRRGDAVDQVVEIQKGVGFARRRALPAVNGKDHAQQKDDKQKPAFLRDEKAGTRPPGNGDWSRDRGGRNHGKKTWVEGFRMDSGFARNAGAGFREESRVTV